MPASHITIRDVAARAGVSHQTVSRVINGKERVSDETRKRVQGAIAELEYAPNAIARFMAQGRTSTFACFSPNLTDYTFACLIEGAESEARRHDFFLLTASAPDVTTFQLLVKQLVDSRRVEGLIVINPYSDDRYQWLPQSVPAVFLGARPRDEQVDSVSLDDQGAGYCATQHLIDLQHRRIAHLTGPLSEDCSQDRQAGFLDAMQEAGLEADGRLIAQGDWSATSGYQVMQRWLEQGLRFSALFAQNDRMAVGAMRALLEAGKSVPGDVSVIGCDDMPLASYFIPALTTLRQEPFKMGQEAAQLLIRALQEPEAARQHLRMQAELIVRRSTARYAEKRR